MIVDAVLYRPDPGFGGKVLILLAAGKVGWRPLSESLPELSSGKGSCLYPKTGKCRKEYKGLASLPQVGRARKGHRAP